MIVKNLEHCYSDLTEVFTFTDDLIIDNFVYADGEILSCKVKFFNTNERDGDTFDLFELGMLSADKKSITFNFKTMNNSFQNGIKNASWWNKREFNKITITATAKEGEPEPKFVELDLKESTININPLPFITDFTETFIVTANEGRFLKSVYVNFYSHPEKFDRIQNNMIETGLSADSKTATINTADIITVSGKTKEQLQEYLYQELKISTSTEIYYYEDRLNRNDGLFSVNITNKITNWADTLIITADAGRIIDTATIGFLADRKDIGVEYDLLGTGDFLSADKTELVVPLTEFIAVSGRTEAFFKKMLIQYINITTIEKLPDEQEEFKSNSFIKSYKADDEVLENISNLMYSGTDGLEGDLMNTIETVFTIPFKIPDELVVPTKRKIYFGAFETPVESNLIKANTIIFDLGIVSVPKIYDSVYDYKNTECILHLPYLELTELDVFKVIGYNIHCLLYLDVYTGQGTYILTSDSINDNLVLKQTVTVGYEIPVLNTSMSMVINNLKDYIYNIDYLFKIEVNRNKPIINDNDKANLVYDTIANYSGNVKVKDVELNSIASFNEKSEIFNLLNQGIIIK